MINLLESMGPGRKCSDLSIYHLDFWIMLFFCCMWTLLTYTKQRIKFSTVYWYLNILGSGERLSWPILSPLQNVSIILFIFQSFELCCSSLHLNTYEYPVSKWELNFQTNKFIGTSTMWGGERLGRPIQSPLQNVLIFLFII